MGSDNQIFVGELIGTMLLVMLGNGTIANINLKNSKGHQGGYLMGSMGYSAALVIAINSCVQQTGAHLNPAVTIGLACINKVIPGQIIFYFLGQFIGAFIGQIMVYLCYYKFYQHSVVNEYELLNNMNVEDNKLKIKNWQNDVLSSFCTVPQNSYYLNCFIGELIGTFVLVLCVVLSSKVYPENVPFFMGIVLFCICLAIGGATGNAVNPARDLVPRICHQIFIIKDKGTSMWKYSFIPILGPIIGGILGALVGNAFKNL